jgi:hypothetical protein
METLTDDDLALLRETDERARRARAAAAPSAPASIATALGRAPDAGARLVNRCEGGCRTPVRARHDWCPSCGALAGQRARELQLVWARRSVTPDDALAWCRTGTREYLESIAGARAVATPEQKVLLERAAWTRDMGSVLILGETGIGKSKFLTAVANRVIDLAAGTSPTDADRLRFAAGVRRISALDLARARAHTKFGEEPELVRVAKSATLLLLDEVGYEDGKQDPHAIRDILRARYEPRPMPVLAASGTTYSELEHRYGAATIRTLTGRGVLIDLHPKRGSR